MAEATASGGDRTETLSGVDGDANAPSELGMGAPANPLDIVSVTAQTPLVFPYIQEEHIFDTAFSWSSEDKAGTIVYQKPMSPVFMNPIISHLSRLFNCWQGGFSIRAIIAGTGFNGGKLACCWLPPNVNPKTLNVAGFTCFPYCVIDPKMNEQVTFFARDQCIQKCHMMGLQGRPDIAANPENFLDEMAKIGGRLVFFVLNPLISASGNACNVNVSLFTAAGADFMMSQVVPPSHHRPGPGPAPPGPVPGPIHETLPDHYFKHLNHPNLEFLEATHLNAYNNSVTTAGDAFTLVDRQTGEFHVFPENKRHGLWPNASGAWSTTINTNAILDGVSIPMSEHHNMSDYPAYHIQTNVAAIGYFKATNAGGGVSDRVYRSDNIGTVYTGSVLAPYGCFGASFSSLDTTGIRNATINLMIANEQRKKAGLFKFTAPTFSSGTPQWFKDKMKVTAPNKERICLFGSNSDTAGGFYMPRDLHDMLRNKFFTAHDDPVYALTDKAQNKPVVYLRLNREGFFSCNVSGSDIHKYELKDFYLKFYNFTPKDSRLPEISGDAANSYFLRKNVEQASRLLKTFEEVALADAIDE